jgi:hypothetical protein
MVSWEKTYQKVKTELDLEAEDKGGVISLKVLEQVICLNIGKDRKRTIPDCIFQLEAAHVIEPINQFSYRYMMNGWREKWKEVKVVDTQAHKDLARVLKAKVSP